MLLYCLSTVCDAGPTIAWHERLVFPGAVSSSWSSRLKLSWYFGIGDQLLRSTRALSRLWGWQRNTATIVIVIAIIIDKPSLYYRLLPVIYMWEQSRLSRLLFGRIQIMEGTEKSPLIKRQVPDTSSEKDAGENQTDYKHESYRSVEDNANREEFKDTVRLKRHITLPYAVAIMVGNVIGSGIFLSPKGVADNAGSVGASLLIWGATGLYNLAQALCYAELGTMIPRAGGDYAYIYEILGPLPAFMLLWIHIVVIASCSCALIARTAGLYLLEPLDMDCHLWLITLIAILIIGTWHLIHWAHNVGATFATTSCAQ